MKETNDWTKCLDYKIFVNIAYTNFAKAFNVVSLSTLWNKIENYGRPIRGSLFAVNKAFFDEFVYA